MNVLKRILTLLLAITVITTQMPTITHAATTSEKDVKSYIEKQLVARKTNITVTTYESKSSTRKSLLNKSGKLLLSVLNKYDKSNNGYYLKWHIKAYTYGFEATPKVNKYKVTYKYTIKYSDSAKKEKEMKSLTKKALKSAKVKKSDSDYTKTKKIYDYICNNVKYKKTNIKQKHYSAYAALKNKKAVCQGYCLATYRMLKESGVKCKFVVDEEENHMWLAIKIGKKYYYADPTWDSKTFNKTDEYRYFLKGTNDFEGHNTIKVKGISKKAYKRD